MINFKLLYRISRKKNALRETKFLGHNMSTCQQTYKMQNGYLTPLHHTFICESASYVTCNSLFTYLLVESRPINRPGDSREWTPVIHLDKTKPHSLTAMKTSSHELLDTSNSE